MLRTENSITALDVFLDLCCTEVQRRAMHETSLGALHAGAVAFRSALDQACVIDPVGSLSTVPALSALPDLASSVLSDAACSASAEVPWIPTPRLTDDGTHVALAMIDQVRDLGEVQCGLVLLDRGAAYPEHSHPPQEIYLPIAGDGRWRYGGDQAYRRVDGDTLVYNNPDDVHGTMAGDEPLLALFILWP